jgi:hypothetical protein
LNRITENGVKNLITGNRIHNYTSKAVHSKGVATLVTGNSGIASGKVQKLSAWKEDEQIDWKWSYLDLRSYLGKLTSNSELH